MVRESEKEATDWKKRIAIYIIYGELMSVIYKEYFKINNEETHKSVGKWAKGMNNQFTEKRNKNSS